MANVNSAATTNGNKKEPGAPASGLTLSSPGEATPASAAPGTPIPVGPSAGSSASTTNPQRHKENTTHGRRIRKPHR